MSLSLTNRDGIIANSYSIITANGSVVDVLDAVQGSIVGLPPSSLNTIEKLSTAISNDPNYFQTMQTSVNAKASQSNTYTKGEVNAFLDGKPDDSELTAAVDSLTSAIGTKQNKFLVAEIPATTGRLFDNNSTKFRAINVASPLSITTPNFDYLTISCDSYTKAESDTKISNLVGAAPELLNTLAELSSALNGNATYATTIANALAAKANTTDLASLAPKASPAFTGETKAPELRTNNIYADTATEIKINDNVIVTGMSTTPSLRVNTIIAHSTTQVNINDNLTVSGNLLVGTTNVLTSLNSKATTTDLNLKAPLDSPPLTGTATAVHLTVSGNLLAGTTNVLTALGEKATTTQLSALETNLTASVNSVSTSQTSNYYTKTQTDGFLNGKVSNAAPTFTGLASA